LNVEVVEVKDLVKVKAGDLLALKRPVKARMNEEKKGGKITPSLAL
jgi:hypothetical protein